MKYINHYFPFFIVTLVIYGFFFHFHKQSTVIPELSINSGQQSMEVQLVEVTETEPTELTEPKPLKTEPNTTPAKNSTPKKDVAKESTPIKKATVKEKPVAGKITPQKINSKKEQPTTEMHTQNSSAVKVAKQQLNKTIKETTTDSVAMLKAELFEAEFHLPPSNLGHSARLTKPRKIQKTAPAPKIKEKVIKPTHSTTVVKPIPVATKTNENKKIKSATPKNTEKTVVKQKSESKAVFRKEPTQSSNAQDQGALQEAIVVSGNTPIYPQRAILRNQQGRVVVKLTVSMQGKAKNPQIVTSSGFPILDNAILDFVKQERFMPAHQGEEKISSEQMFSFRFELK
jgi:protein TonB